MAPFVVEIIAVFWLAGTTTTDANTVDVNRLPCASRPCVVVDAMVDVDGGSCVTTVTFVAVAVAVATATDDDDDDDEECEREECDEDDDDGEESPLLRVLPLPLPSLDPVLLLLLDERVLLPELELVSLLLLPPLPPVAVLPGAVVHPYPS